MKNKNQTKENTQWLYLAAIICAVAVIGMIAALTLPPKNETGTFIPPAFDSTAVAGIPTVEDSLAWMEVSQEGMSFSAHVCGEVIINNSKADIYFTSAEENQVWLKLRVLDTGGNILGETGLIRPGEYVQSVIFDTLPENGETIRLKLMSYEPETYYSAGAVMLNTTAKIGG